MARKSPARGAAARPTSARRTKQKNKVRHRTDSGRGKAAKSVYYFGEGKADGNGKMKGLLGGKGANLAEMTRIGLPVPPGFTISTEVCTYYYDNKKKYPKELKKDVLRSLQKMEKAVGMKFGRSSDPLLVSVRSGARASMPGMM